MSEANHQTESKDPVPAGSATSDVRSFRIVIRFFDENDAECVSGASREAAARVSPARRCRVSEGKEPESRRDGATF